MKLLILTGMWPTKKNPISGIFVVQQAQAFARLGCNVKVVNARNIYKSQNQSLSLAELGCSVPIDLSDLNVFTAPEQLLTLPGTPHLNTRATGFAVSQRISAMQSSRWAPEAVLVHGIRYLALSAPYWRDLVDGSVVQVIHGVDPKLDQTKTLNRFRGIVSKSVRCFDATVVVGSPLKKHMMQLGIDNACIVPNGTDLPPYKSVNMEQGSPSRKPVILSVSNLIALKGIDLNLRALGQLARTHPRLDWEYRIVGEGPESVNLKKLAYDLGITSKVRFWGRIPYPDTMNEIDNCDLFCLPSWGEAFGIVYLEAMARGRPVIGCWENGAQDIITHDRDGLLVAPRDLYSLTQALCRLLVDPNERSRLGAAARSKAEVFTWDTNAKRMLDLLHQREVMQLH